MVRTTMSMVAVGAALLIAILLATPRPAAAIDDPVGDMVPVSEPVSGNTIGTPTGPPQAGRGDITDVSVQLVPGGLLVCVTRLSDVVTTSTAILWFFGTPGATLIQGFWENHNGVVSSRAASQMGTVPATFDVDAAGSFGCITIPTANLDGIQTVFVYSLSRQTPLGQQPPAEGDPRLRDESGYHTVPAQADEPTNTLTPTPTDTPTPTNTPTPTPTPTPPDEDDAGDGETAASDEPDDDGGAGDGTSDDDAGASDDTDDPVTDDESDNNDQGGAAASDDGDEADGPGGDDDPDAAAAGADDETDTDNDGGGATLATDLADDGGIPIGMILLIGLLALAGGGLVFLLYRLRGGDVPVAPAGLAMDAGSAGTLGGGIAGTGPARDTRGDMNEDGVVDARDYDAFRDRTRRTLPDGDIDGDADVDASDIEALHRAAGSQPGDPAGDTPPSGADPRASTPEPETTTGTESAQEDPPLALQLAPSEVPPSLEPEAPPPPRPGIPQPDVGTGDDGISYVGDQAMIDEPPDASAGRMSGGVFAVEPPTPAPEPGIPRPDLGGDDGIPYVGDQTMAEEPGISVAGPGIPEGSPAGGTAGDAPGAGPVSDDPSRAAPVDPISSPSDFVFEMPYAPSFPVHWPARDRQRTPHEILSEELEHLDRIADGWNHVAADEHRRKFDETMREIGQDSIGVGLTTPDEQQWESWRRLSEIRQQLARDELTTNLEDLERLRTDPEFRAQRRREIEAELKKHPPVQEPHAGAPDAQQEPVPAPSAPAPVEEPTPALAPAAERVGVTPSFTAGEEDEQSREPSFTFHAPIPYGEEWSYEESLRNEYAFIERLGHEPFFFGNPPQWWKDAQQQHYGTTYRERMQPGANTAEERERIERGHEERLDELETLRTDPEAREKRLLEIHDEMQRVGTGEQPTPTDEPILTIRSAVRDEPLTSVTGVDEFFVVVDLPPGEGTPPETITVKLDASSDGDQEELKLEFVGVVEGNWRYASHDRVTVGEVVSYTVNDVIAIGYGDHGTTFRVYETPEKQRLGEVGDALHELQDDLNGAREQINSLATDEGLERAIEQLDKVGEQSRDAIDEMDPTEEERKQALEDMDETIEQGKEELRRLHGDKAARDEVIAEIDRRLEHVRQGLTHVHAADANYDFDAATGLRPLEGLEAHWDVDTALAMRAETELRLALSSPDYSGHGTQSPADRASSSRAATEEAIGLYKADLTGRHTKEIGLAAVMTILDTPFIPLLPGFLTGYGIATGEDYVTGQQIPLTERALNLAIHVVMTAFAVKLVGATGFGGALSGVRIRVAGPGRPGTGGRRTGTGRPGTRRPPAAAATAGAAATPPMMAQAMAGRAGQAGPRSTKPCHRSTRFFRPRAPRRRSTRRCRQWKAFRLHAPRLGRARPRRPRRATTVCSTRRLASRRAQRPRPSTRRGRKRSRPLRTRDHRAVRRRNESPHRRHRLRGRLVTRRRPACPRPHGVASSYPNPAIPGPARRRRSSSNRPR